MNFRIFPFASHLCQNHNNSVSGREGRCDDNYFKMRSRARSGCSHLFPSACICDWCLLIKRVERHTRAAVVFAAAACLANHKSPLAPVGLMKWAQIERAQNRTLSFLFCEAWLIWVLCLAGGEHEAKIPILLSLVYRRNNDILDGEHDWVKRVQSCNGSPYIFISSVKVLRTFCLMSSTRKFLTCRKVFFSKWWAKSIFEK